MLKVIRYISKSGLALSFLGHIFSHHTKVSLEREGSYSAEAPLTQWFSTGGNFCLPGDNRHCLQTFLIVTTRDRYDWHPVCRDQGCCETPYNAQDRSLQHRSILSKMSIMLTLRNLFFLDIHSKCSLSRKPQCNYSLSLARNEDGY